MALHDDRHDQLTAMTRDADHIAVQCVDGKVQAVPWLLAVNNNQHNQQVCTSSCR